MRFQRGRAAVVLVSGLLVAGLAGGCERGTAADPGDRTGWPVGAAGRACQLLDYAIVEAALGTRFDTAGGASVETTYTCVLTHSAQQYPDLTLAVSPSTFDELIFTAIVTPSGSTPVPNLGRIAYSVQRPAAEGSGPGAEIGWLSATERLMILRYMFAADAGADQLAELWPKLVAFAQQIDASLPAAPVT